MYSFYKELTDKVYCIYCIFDIYYSVDITFGTFFKIIYVQANLFYFSGSY